jgi:4-amino-4-deoxy-L-arabinose transferase-like glycosyltransferase
MSTSPDAPPPSASTSGPRPRFAERAEYRFGLVLLLLLVTFVFLATGPTGGWARPVTVLLQGATLIAALYASRVGPRLRNAAILVTVIALLAALGTITLGESTAGAGFSILNALLVGIAPVAIAVSVLRRRVIDVQTVLAALCIYVLLGMLWAFVFTAMGSIDPPFFEQGIKATSADYLYFSFITQTTVGYGDLTAADNAGRACAVLEALIGQIYLVTIVALLVSNLGHGRRLTTEDERAPRQ